MSTPAPHIPRGKSVQKFPKSVNKLHTLEKVISVSSVIALYNEMVCILQIYII